MGEILYQFAKNILFRVVVLVRISKEKKLVFSFIYMLYICSI